MTQSATIVRIDETNGRFHVIAIGDNGKETLYANEPTMEAAAQQSSRLWQAALAHYENKIEAKRMSELRRTF